MLSLFASPRLTVKKHVFMLSLIQNASNLGSVTFQTTVLLKQQQNPTTYAVSALRSKSHMCMFKMPIFISYQ